jgi:hypothetical protein
MAQRPVDAARSLLALALSLLPAATQAQSEEDAILIRSGLIAPARGSSARRRVAR